MSRLENPEMDGIKPNNNLYSKILCLKDAQNALGLKNPTFSAQSAILNHQKKRDI